MCKTSSTTWQLCSTDIYWRLTESSVSSSLYAVWLLLSLISTTTAAVTLEESKPWECNEKRLSVRARACVLKEITSLLKQQVIKCTGLVCRVWCFVILGCQRSNLSVILGIRLPRHVMGKFSFETSEIDRERINISSRLCI